MEICPTKGNSERKIMVNSIELNPLEPNQETVQYVGEITIQIPANTVGVGVMSVVKQGMSVQNFSQLIKKWGKEIKRPCLCLHLHNPCTCQDLLKPITTLH
jgi:hypothetical protein